MSAGSNDVARLHMSVIRNRLILTDDNLISYYWAQFFFIFFTFFLWDFKHLDFSIQCHQSNKQQQERNNHVVVVMNYKVSDIILKMCLFIYFIFFLQAFNLSVYTHSLPFICQCSVRMQVFHNLTTSSSQNCIRTLMGNMLPVPPISVRYCFSQLCWKNETIQIICEG